MKAVTTKQAPARCFIVAEGGVNHNGDLRLAKRIIEEAAEAGADAIKFQTFTADRLVTPQAPKARYQIASTGSRESQFEMLRKLELPRKAYPELMQCAARRGLVFFSTPFDEEGADLLESLDVPLFKIPSGEITNLPFLAHVAAKRKPVILSTGMSTLAEVKQAVKVLQGAGCRRLTLLHCTSHYPADFGDCNLRAMETMARAFRLPVGYSDHTSGIAIAPIAVALGAAVIEKHFTVDRRLPGPDHQASLEPAAFAEMVRAIRQVEAAMGDGIKKPAPSEHNTSLVARKSIVAACNVPVGTRLEERHLACKRPGTGISPADFPRLLGRRLKKPLSANELVSWAHVK